jgi:hypothetical protein
VKEWIGRVQAVLNSASPNSEPIWVTGFQDGSWAAADAPARAERIWKGLVGALDSFPGGFCSGKHPLRLFTFARLANPNYTSGLKDIGFFEPTASGGWNASNCVTAGGVDSPVCNAAEVSPADWDPKPVFGKMSDVLSQNCR